jgi:UDP-N-acetylmuramoyl-L-alanyl-D-glutamate--2,6-diaminopimelate ligase
MKTIAMPTIYPVASHTDNVGVGSTFVVIKGNKQDGVQYIMLAIEKGASRIVIQKDLVLPVAIEAALKNNAVDLIRVEDTRKALADLSAQALGYPAKKLKILAITGTKGKTTSTFLLEHILRSAGYKTALLSTVKNMIDGCSLKTNLTTQHPDYLQVFFDLCVTSGIDYVVMETAAQAFTLHRTAGILFDGVIFTNFEREHSEFYATIEDYFAAKSMIFKQLKPGAPVLVNADDSWCQKLIAQYKVTTFGLTSLSVDYLAKENSDHLCTISWQSGEQVIEAPSLVGRFNIYNVAGVFGLLHKLGVDADTIAMALRSFTSIPGRMERYVLPNGAVSFIDYAHTPASFTNLLSLLRSMTDNLIVVFGAGGDRDRTKRPIMGKITSELADIVILTTDNPRTEVAETIADEIMVGVDAGHQHKILRILDREEAICKAYDLSKSGSIIALLGKGPDEYQIIGDAVIPFSEKTILKSLS